MDDLKTFLKKYEDATNSHDFDQVAPLLAVDAVYWFSDGSFEGREAIRAAFIKTWDTVKQEIYRIEDVRWLAVSATAAVCVYSFSWQGIINGVQRSGVGRGTNAMVKAKGNWLMVHEHLSKLV
jgi:ketosteroid isomerase-like protein